MPLFAAVGNRVRAYCTLYPTNDLRPTISPIYKYVLSAPPQPTNKKGQGTHFKNPIRLNSINPHLRQLPILRELPPIPQVARARPERGVRGADGCQRGGRLEALGDVDLLQDRASDGEVVEEGVEVCCGQAGWVG